MGWSIGYDKKWNRDIGYGVPAICDHPGCDQEIDRGLSYVCGGEPYGGEHGCGLFFCSKHLLLSDHYDEQLCVRCCADKEPFEPKPDVARWLNHKLNDESWAEWRNAHPNEVRELTAQAEDA